MFSQPISRTRPETHARYRAETLEIPTTRRVQFLDITDAVSEVLRRSGVTLGVVNVQTRHTTTGIVVNENEPLLLRDVEDRLSRLAPREEPYRHDDLSIRTVNLTPEERPNGDSHCRAIVLGTSESLNVVDGELQLGRWQRIFLVELDGAQHRHVSVVAMGVGEDPVDHRELFLPVLRVAEAVS
jgi:secondary thiamine-phosphate synthase enzyme